MNKNIAMTIGAGLFLAGNALANNVHVTPGNVNFPTIQQAVDYVPISTTATLTISSGTYAEHIIVDGKHITFTGNGATGPNATLIGFGGGIIFDTAGSHPYEQLYFNKLCIQNGQSSTSGGGLRLTDGASASLQNCWIKDNVAAATGGGIFIQGGANPPSVCILNNCTVAGNQCPANGGSGIDNYSTNPNALQLKNCNITGNVQDPQIAGPHIGENLTIGPINGDLDEDGDIDAIDVHLVEHEAGICNHDTNGDGHTNILDVLDVIIGWGASCAP